MDLDEAQKRSLDIKRAYDVVNVNDGHKKWGAGNYMSGFAKDVGDLSKLIMVKEGLRGHDGDLEHDLKHEIGDCFWSLFVLCHELGISPEEALETTLSELEGRLRI